MIFIYSSDVTVKLKLPLVELQHLCRAQPRQKPGMSDNTTTSSETHCKHTICLTQVIFFPLLYDCLSINSNWFKIGTVKVNLVKTYTSNFQNGKDHHSIELPVLKPPLSSNPNAKFKTSVNNIVPTIGHARFCRISENYQCSQDRHAVGYQLSTVKLASVLFSVSDQLNWERLCSLPRDTATGN